MRKRERFEQRCQEMKARNEARQSQNGAVMSQPSGVLTQTAVSVARGVTPLIKAKDVAKRMGMSVHWVRQHFEKVPGVVAIRSPKRRGVRVYTTLLVPENVLADELRKFSVRPPVW